MSIIPATLSHDVDRHPLIIPNHIGMIMDGNGRWANMRGLKRTDGHSAGVTAIRNAVELCVRYGVKYLTLYSFSTENWRRPAFEVNFIFGLLRRFVASDLQRLIAQNVCVKIIGDRAGLEQGLIAVINDVEEKTRNNDGLTLIIAFNYGSKAEITSAVKRIAASVKAGEIDVNDISEKLITDNLDTAHIPDPDIIIRTSGEQRLSNFLLWQAAYSEFVFLDEFWPDFDETIFLKALKIYSSRDRRYGGLTT